MDLCLLRMPNQAKDMHQKRYLGLMVQDSSVQDSMESAFCLSPSTMLGATISAAASAER